MVTLYTRSTTVEKKTKTMIVRTLKKLMYSYKDDDDITLEYLILFLFFTLCHIYVHRKTLT